MQAWRLALLFYSIRGVVWCGMFASYLIAWMDSARYLRLEMK